MTNPPMDFWAGRGLCQFGLTGCLETSPYTHQDRFWQIVIVEKGWNASRGEKYNDGSAAPPYADQEESNGPEDRS